MVKNNRGGQVLSQVVGGGEETTTPFSNIFPTTTLPTLGEFQTFSPIKTSPTLGQFQTFFSNI